MPTPRLTAPEVLAAAAEWIYLPDTARVVRTEGLVVVAYPMGFDEPTQAVVLDSARESGDLLAAGAGAATSLGRDVLTWVVGDTTRPPGLEPELLARGAAVVEELDVLAVPLAGPLPDLGVPDDVELRTVDDLASVRRALEVEREAFDNAPVDEDRARSALRELTDEPGRYRRVVAVRDGVAVGSAGLTVAEHGVLRLWGAGTTLAARGTGVYRALLADRLRTGVERGCRFAITTARVGTSSPILRRNGFEAYGRQRLLRLAVDALRPPA